MYISSCKIIEEKKILKSIAEQKKIRKCIRTILTFVLGNIYRYIYTYIYEDCSFSEQGKLLDIRRGHDSVAAAAVQK